jgi:hypothetical protein
LRATLEAGLLPDMTPNEVVAAWLLTIRERDDLRALLAALEGERDALRNQVDQQEADTDAQTAIIRENEALREENVRIIGRLSLERDAAVESRAADLAASVAVIRARDEENMRLREERDGLRGRFTAPIVCMCGSVRFRSTWAGQLARLADEGCIVLTIGRMLPKASGEFDPAHKERLDWLHKRKIDLCDWVWVLDVGGYIGDSTKSEIAYAESIGRPVRYLSRELPGYVELPDEIAALRARLAALEAEKVEDERTVQSAHDAEQRARERLAEVEGERERLRGALQQIGDLIDKADDEQLGPTLLTIQILARAALSPQPEGDKK